MNVYHRHFINNDHIRFQRVFRVSLKMYVPVVSSFFRQTTQFQKTVDRLGFIPGGFRHSLCRSSGRGRQSQLDALSFKKTDDRVDRCGFSCSRASCKDKESVRCRFCHSLFLHLVQNSPCFFLYLRDSSLDHLFVFRAKYVQFLQHTGGIQFQVIIAAGIYQDAPVFFLLDYFPIHGKIHKMFFHIGFIYAQKL